MTTARRGSRLATRTSVALLGLTLGAGCSGTEFDDIGSTAVSASGEAGGETSAGGSGETDSSGTTGTAGSSSASTTGDGATAGDGDGDAGDGDGGCQYYGDPLDGCCEDEVEMTVGGVPGSFCSPSCETSICPESTAGFADCRLGPNTMTPINCVVLCSDFAGSTDCPEGATCFDASGTGVCTYP